MYNIESLELYRNKMLQFLTCCEDNDLKTLNSIYELVDFSYQRELGFRIACEKGNLDIVKRLLELNPNLNLSIMNESAFISACKNGKLNVVEYLYDLYNWDIEEAFIRSPLNICQYLLSRRNINSYNEAISYSIETNDVEKFLFFISKINYKNHYFIQAIRSNNFQIAEYLHQNYGCFDENALLETIKKGHYLLFDYILSFSSEISLSTFNTAFFLCCQYNRFTMAKCLYHIKDKSIIPNKYNISPEIYNIENVEFLDWLLSISKFIDFDILYENAIINGKLNVLEYLSSKNYHINTTFLDFQKLFIITCKNNNFTTVQFMCNVFDIDLTCNDYCVFYISIFNNNKQMLSFFLTKETPDLNRLFKYSCEMGNYQMCEFLISKGATFHENNFIESMVFDDLKLIELLYLPEFNVQYCLDSYFVCFDVMNFLIEKGAIIKKQHMNRYNDFLSFYALFHHFKDQITKEEANSYLGKACIYQNMDIANLLLKHFNNIIDEEMLLILITKNDIDMFKLFYNINPFSITDEMLQLAGELNDLTFAEYFISLNPNLDACYNNYQLFLKSVYIDDLNFAIFFHQKYPNAINKIDMDDVLSCIFKNSSTNFLNWIFSIKVNIDLSEILNIIFIYELEPDFVDLILSKCSHFNPSCNENSFFINAVITMNKSLINWCVKNFPFWYKKDGNVYIATCEYPFNGNIIHVNDIEKCTLCMENNQNIQLCCDHRYCENCIKSWYSKQRTCPLCRKLIKEYFRIDLVKSNQ